MGQLELLSQNQDHGQGYYCYWVRLTERGMVGQHECDWQENDLRFDEGVSLVETNVSGTVCANANHHSGRYGGSKLEMYAHDDCHEGYWKPLWVHMEQKSVEWYVVIDGECCLHVLMKSCSEENERASGGKNPQADCQRVHCVDLSPGSSSFLGHHHGYETVAVGDVDGDLREYEGRDLLLAFVGRDRH